MNKEKTEYCDGFEEYEGNYSRKPVKPLPNKKGYKRNFTLRDYEEYSEEWEDDDWDWDR